MNSDENNFAAIRNEYLMSRLDEHLVLPDPYSQFQKWFEEAQLSGVPEPTACALATADSKGSPSVRMVLLKGMEEGGFIFFTNYKSKKGKDLKKNPLASMCFFWPEVQRQVRIEGTIKKISKEESDAYFISRPEESRIGAWASPQSETIPSREWLELRFDEMKDTLGDKTQTRPKNWGGYILQPKTVEFWQGRANRLHDRIVYLKAKKKGWELTRLAP